MRRIRSTLAALFFVVLVGGAQACVENPTAPDDEIEDGALCWWVDGILHCRE